MPFCGNTVNMLLLQTTVDMAEIIIGGLTTTDTVNGCPIQVPVLVVTV